MSQFFACLSRLRLIRRWSLMRNVENENVQEHSWRVAILAHGLAVLARQRFGRDVNPERAATLGLFHDASEALTGDLPTPVKYFSPDIKKAYHDIEARARDAFIDLLPEAMRPVYRPLLATDDDESPAEVELVHWADKVCAWLKCREELRSGNPEFARAEAAIREKLASCPLAEVKCFMEEFAPAFDLTLDELAVIQNV